jgi:SAM-dependent methyltransferase
MDSFASGFAGVDSAGDARSFVQYLEMIHALPFFQECKRETYRKLGIRPGASVLDIGCGNGVDATVLAGLAGPDGRVIGIDVSATMLSSARALGAGTGNPPGYVLCNAGGLPFSGESFDAVRADRVLQHTGDPAAVLREMARVTRPGGKIVVFEPDWETFVIAPGGRGVTRTILNYWCDRIPSGWAGRSLYPAFAAAGLETIEACPACLVITSLPLARRIFDLDTTIRLVAEAGLVTSREAESWAAGHSEADAAGSFFSSLTFYLVSGTKRE